MSRRLFLIFIFVLPFGAQAEPDISQALREALSGLPAADSFNAELQKVYTERGYRLLWIEQNRPTRQAVALADSLLHADSHGLNPADYDASRLQAEISSPPSSSVGQASLDIALSRSAARYAQHLRHGRIGAATLDKLGMALPAKPALNAAGLLSDWAQSSDLATAINALAPSSKAYAALQAALARYRGLSGNEQAPVLTLTGIKSLHPGERHDAVPVLRNKLLLDGYLTANSQSADAALYDDALGEAVRRFQTRHGIEPDGVVGGNTLTQLNTSPANRIAQLRLGLERLRWLPASHDKTYLVVNVPSFRLYGFESGIPDLASPSFSSDVIVGQASDTRNTPVFHADMKYLVFRPYWNVPNSIARNELVPLIERDGGYMNKNEMEIVAAYGDGEGAILEPSEANLDAVYNGKLRLRQRPGGKNALGQIKFVFPNMNSVYLHGTPQQRLFLRARRDFSHGCIRVENPAGLAEFVLKKTNGWDKPSIENAMNGDRTFTLRLADAIPVYIFYTTALADAQGQALFYPDIYNQDARLLKLLDKPES